MTTDPAAAAFAATPSNRLLGARLLERSAARVLVELPLRDELLQEAGIVQGGLLTALADTAAVYVLWPDLGSSRTMTGTDCTMNFLSAATRHGGTILATATPLRIGRTLAITEVVLEQAGRLVAKGTFRFLLRCHSV